ncbi:MAG: uL4 family ribosomal protein [Candidatus Parcubacteria bacterium]|nr:uL4 family ribosomal protein [Candidatus Parcubacteria bacterium]
MTLTDKVKENKLVVLEKIELAKIKTKDLIKILNKLPAKNFSALIIMSAKDDNIIKSARNLKKIKTILADSLNVLDILKCNYLLIDKAGIKKLIETYK